MLGSGLKNKYLLIKANTISLFLNTLILLLNVGRNIFAQSFVNSSECAGFSDFRLGGFLLQDSKSNQQEE